MDPISIWLRIHSALIRLRAAQSERGASVVEYALLVGFIAIVCIVAISFVGTSAKTPLNTVGSSLAP